MDVWVATSSPSGPGIRKQAFRYCSHRVRHAVTRAAEEPAHGRPLPDRRVDADDVQVVAHCLDAEPAVGHLRDDPRTGVGGGGVGAKADHRARGYKCAQDVNRDAWVGGGQDDRLQVVGGVDHAVGGDGIVVDRVPSSAAAEDRHGAFPTC